MENSDVVIMVLLGIGLFGIGVLLGLNLSGGVVTLRQQGYVEAPQSIRR